LDNGVGHEFADDESRELSRLGIDALSLTGLAHERPGLVGARLVAR
jgi:hypothetical protein